MHARRASRTRKSGLSSLHLENAWICSCCLVPAATWSVASAATDSSVSSTSSKLVMGLGPALFAMIVLGVVCFLVCVFGCFSEQRIVPIGAVVFLASVVGLFFLSVNVESAEEVTAKKMKYNQMAVTRSALAALMIAFTVVSLFSVLLLHVIKPRQVHWWLAVFRWVADLVTIFSFTARLRQGHYIGEAVHQLNRQRLF